MQCDFRLISGPDETGWHKVRCQRCGLIVRTPHPPDRVDADCRFLAPYGVGDAIAWLTEATGIAAWWHKKTAPKGGCGCKKRQAALNRVLPFPARVRGLMALLAVWWIDRRSSAPERP